MRITDTVIKNLLTTLGELKTMLKGNEQNNLNTSFPEYHGYQGTWIGSLRVLIEYLEDVTGTTESISPL